MNKNFICSYLEMINQQKSFSRFNTDYFSINQINSNILLEQIQNVLNESQNPDYYVKFPKELIKLTKQKQIIDKYDILTLFPQFQNISFPNIFISFFDFSNKDQVSKFLKGVAKINDQKILRIFQHAFSTSSKRGFFVDLAKFGIKLGFLIFNSKLYNERTIFHQWTHLFQTYVGDKFKKYVQLSQKNIQNKNKKLKKFDLTFDIVQNYFFSQKQYITRLDNLIYMIHQIQKIDKYKSLNDEEFWNIFKKQVIKNQFNSQLVNDILKIDKNFKVDIEFFIAAKICFDGQLFTKLCFDISKRI